MPSLRQILKVVGVTLLGVVIAGIVGFLSAAHLEISFDKLKEFRATELKSYVDLVTSIRFDFDLAQPAEYRAYFGENDNETTRISSMQLSLRTLRMSNKVQGRMEVAGGGGYSIVGYYNDTRWVLSHRGRHSGVGVYLLQSTQFDDLSAPVFLGYLIAEDVRKDGEIWITRCPIVMMPEDIAREKFPSPEGAQDRFAILKNGCRGFTVPRGTGAGGLQRG